jgi:hypothetical protein
MAILMVVFLCAGYLVFSVVIVHATGPAVVKLGRNGGQLPAGMTTADIRYPILTPGNGNSDNHGVAKITRPDFVLPAFDGVLLGSDRGEWGGELVFRDRDGKFHQLLNRNVRGIVRTPSGIVVFVGLAHLFGSAGGIYRVSLDGDGTVAATLIHDLRGSPRAIQWTRHGDLVFQVDILAFRRYGLLSSQKTRCFLLDSAGMLRRQLCAAILH